MNNQKFYQKAWFMWIMLFLFAPVGIVLLWMYKHHNKVARIVLTLFFGFVFLAIAVGGGGEEKKTKVDSKPVVNSEEQKQKEPEEKNEKQKKEELEKQRLAEEEAAAKAEAEKQAKLEEEKKKAAEEKARLQAEAEEKARQEAEEAAAQQAQQAAETSTPVSDTISYKNCTEARAAGAAPIYQGQPGYASHLDRDGDGIGCDK